MSHMKQLELYTLQPHFKPQTHILTLYLHSIVASLKLLLCSSGVNIEICSLPHHLSNPFFFVFFSDTYSPFENCLTSIVDLPGERGYRGYSIKIPLLRGGYCNLYRGSTEGNS